MDRYDIITKENRDIGVYASYEKSKDGEFVQYDDIENLLKLCKKVLQDIRIYNDDDPTASSKEVQDLYKELKKLDV